MKNPPEIPILQLLKNSCYRNKNEKKQKNHPGFVLVYPYLGC